MRSLLEIQKCTSIEKSQCLCGFPLLSGCTSMPRSCTLSLILVHLYNNENPSVYAGLRHCCTLSYSKPWGPWPDWTSRLLAFRKGGSLRKSRVETSKSFVHLFKGGGVWGETPRPSGVARGPGARWAPFRTGLRCHFGRCWASATGRQHPRRQPRPKPLPSPTPKKGGRMSPSWGATEPGVLLVEGAGRVPPRPGLALSPYGRMRALPCTFSTGCAG